MSDGEFINLYKSIDLHGIFTFFHMAGTSGQKFQSATLLRSNNTPWMFFTFF